MHRRDNLSNIAEKIKDRVRGNIQILDYINQQLIHNLNFDNIS